MFIRKCSRTSAAHLRIEVGSDTQELSQNLASKANSAAFTLNGARAWLCMRDDGAKNGL
jgi:hypothetical protein